MAPFTSPRLVQQHARTGPQDRTQQRAEPLQVGDAILQEGAKADPKRSEILFFLRCLYYRHGILWFRHDLQTYASAVCTSPIQVAVSHKAYIPLRGGKEWPRWSLMEKSMGANHLATTNL